MTIRPPFERDIRDRAQGPRWSETHLGVVVDVGTGERLGQVQVRLFAFDGEADQDGPMWARVAVAIAGQDRGSFLIPDKDDEVLTTFIGGDSRLPVVIGSLWNGNAEPPDDLSSNSVDTWSFTTPNDTKVVIKETSASDAEVRVEVGSQVSASFTASSGGKIELKVGTSSVTIQSSGIEITTSGTLEMDGSTATISAGLVDVDAPFTKFGGTTQATTAIATTVVGTTYTPGAGNIW